MDFSLIAATPVFSWTTMESWLAILQMVVGLGFVIFVHELGHFLVAKACGVKCEKFYVGFDMFDIKIGDTVIIPKTLVSKQWGETEYGIGIVPLGGYVKMLGQDDNPAKAAEERERSLMAKESEDGIAVDGEYQLDPRSYQAKTVWQRMAIISAGVIMNLIFAVIFAGIAWGIGVKYSPTELGSTIAGAPAWEQNIRPGDVVLGVGDEERAREPFRFRYDLNAAIIYNGDKNDLALTILPKGSETTRTVMVRPSTRVLKIKGALPPLIGIGSAAIPVLPDEEPCTYNRPAWLASQGDNGFQPGDTVLKVDDLEIKSVVDMQQYVAVNSSKTITFQVRRKSTFDEEDNETLGPTVTFEVKPGPLKMLGIEMKYGPITAIQKESPAELAGLQKGDKLIAYNGTPIGNPLTLSQRLRKLAGSVEPTKFTILREDEEITVDIAVRQPYTNNIFSSAFDGRIAVDEIGVAFLVQNVVGSVVAGSAAEEAGMKPGDEITQVDFVAASDEERDIEKEKLGFGVKSNTVKLTDDNSTIWPSVFQKMQSRLSTTKLVLTFERKGEVKQASLTPTNSDQFFSDTRGLHLVGAEESYTAKTLAECVERGFTQTTGDALKVVTLLGKLVKGEVSPVNLGGPGTIARAATGEALQGPSHFLLFLTLISANLAVVNFLPIPVLDGGHMVFLIYEAIFRKPISEKLQVVFSFAGLLFIFVLMLTVISLDIWRAIP